jgi:hypothetical protein
MKTEHTNIDKQVLNEELNRLKALSPFEKWKLIEEITDGHYYISNLKRVAFVQLAATLKAVRKDAYNREYFVKDSERVYIVPLFNKYWKTPNEELVLLQRQKQYEKFKKQAKERSIRCAEDVDFLTTSEDKAHYAKCVYEALLWGYNN